MQPTNALEIVQTQAEKLYANGRAVVNDKLGVARAERDAAEVRADDYATTTL